MSITEANWTSLSKGIEIPTYGVIVPWLIAEADLFQLIPLSEFTISAGGCWPTLRFKFLGFSAVWGFNFVSHPSGLLSELQFRNSELHSPKRTYRRSRAQLHKALGRPNTVDLGHLGQQTWRKGGLRVNNWIASGARMPSAERVPVHTLSIFVRSSG
jgi:hypothetical protein